MGGSRNLREQQRQRIPGPQGLKPITPGSATMPSTTPGPLGHNDAAATTLIAQAKAKALPKPVLTVDLDLNELIDLNIVEEHKTGGLIRKGPAWQKDPGRPKKVLEIVRTKFSPLQDKIRINLGTGVKSGRFLKVRFHWEHSDTMAGISSVYGSRTKKLEKMTLAKSDRGKGLTAYVFEGPIDLWMEKYFPEGKSVNVNNVFAAAIAHELGHNLGLEHMDSPGDLMFDLENKSYSAQKKWVTLAEQNALAFRGWQIQKVRQVLDKP